MEYSKDYISELMKWIDPLSLLVLTENGKLKRIYCPFNAEVIISIGNFRAGDMVTVDAMKLTINLEEVYIIAGRAYFIFHFRIIL